MNDLAGTSAWDDLMRRLRSNSSWIAAQFWLTLVLVLAGLAWTRLPDRYAWQVGLSLLLPVLLAAVFLWLQARTIRALGDQDQKTGHDQRRSPLLVGALMLLVWFVLVWLAWWLLDWCDDQIPTWASYLNSRAPAHARARLSTYEHIQLWLTLLEWILRWIVLPAKVIPLLVASAQWGWRLPWRRLIRLLLQFRWWLAVVVASLVGAALPAHFFAGVPDGTVAHQVWRVMFKLAGAYLLAVACWVLLLAWAAVLLAREGRAVVRLDEDSARLPLPESGGDPGGDA